MKSSIYRKAKKIKTIAAKALFLLYNDKRAFLRAIYVRTPILVRLRAAQIQFFSIIRKPLRKLFLESAENLPAIEVLSKRRLQKIDFLSERRDNKAIDISVVTYNSAHWIDRFIDSLLAQDYPLSQINMIFVDHGSSDETISKILKLKNQLGSQLATFTLLQQANKGFGAGHDLAIRSSKSDLILISNVDIEFNSDSLCRIIETASYDADDVAAWEMRQLPFEHPKHYDPVTLETNWQSHACVLMRRDAYVRVGGYEPKIFMYGEDVELSYRFRSYGYILRYIPSAAITHHSYADQIHLFKPLQYTGSTIANLIIRLRYGTSHDVLIGFLIYLGNILRAHQPFPDVRRTLIKNLVFVLRHSIYFKHGRGYFPAHFPFRAFDFDLRREGANYYCQALRIAPRVTIITRTHEAPGRDVLLYQCGYSIINQTYPNIEWLVVQDGPGKKAQTVVNHIADKAPWLTTRFIECENKGRSFVGNVALEEASGTYCLFLDDDDLIYADHLETLYNAIQKEPSAKAAYALSFEVQAVNDQGVRVDKDFNTPEKFRQIWDYNILLDHNFIPIQSILFERDLFLEFGGFDCDLDQLEDWNLWLRYGYLNKFVYVPKTTSLFFTPIEKEERLRRHLALHEAYVNAKESALAEIDKREDGGYSLPQIYQERRFVNFIRNIFDTAAYGGLKSEVQHLAIR
jgi:GT2 family glycosyltransferase